MKPELSKNKIFQILISVDEQKLRLQREGLDSSFSLEEAIQNEFGWFYESGIYLDKICKHKQCAIKKSIKDLEQSYKK